MVTKKEVRGWSEAERRGVLGRSAEGAARSFLVNALALSLPAALNSGII